MVDIDAVRNWLGRLPGGSQAGRYSNEWDAFEKLDRPVVTLFGSYDTGKSSLLRRLLVDSGGEVPDWLTISARHETFEVNDVEVGACIVRDTPGLAVGASDIRAQNNSRRAMAAVGLTDIGVAVLTPQLATAERDVLQKLITQEWPAGAMWFVISRFDEAGVDPEYDLAEYRTLSERKIHELHQVFELDADTPVFVVSQDPYQTAGSDNGIDRELWDEFRGWDGVDDLMHALEAVDRSSLSAWRQSAGQRYWSTAVAETLDELRSQLADYVARAEVAASGVARRDAWERELDVLDRAAQSSLGGLVDEVFRRSWDRTGSGTSDLQQDVQRALDDWFAKHDVRLQRLAQSIRKTRERERARPSWDGFAALVSTLGRGPEDTQMVTKSDGVAGHVDTVGKMLINLLKATNGKSGSGGKGKSGPVKGAGEAVRYIGVAEAALPLAVYAAQFVDKQMADRARAAQDQDAIDQRQQIIAECTLRAREAWQPFVDEVRATIIEETSDQVDLDESLRRLVDQLEVAVKDGERLLPGSAPVSPGVRA